MIFSYFKNTMNQSNFANIQFVVVLYKNKGTLYDHYVITIPINSVQSVLRLGNNSAHSHQNAITTPILPPVPLAQESTY